MNLVRSPMWFMALKLIIISVLCRNEIDIEILRIEKNEKEFKKIKRIQKN